MCVILQCQTDPQRGDEICVQACAVPYRCQKSGEASLGSERSIILGYRPKHLPRWLTNCPQLEFSPPLFCHMLIATPLWNSSVGLFAGVSSAPVTCESLIFDIATCAVATRLANSTAHAAEAAALVDAQSKGRSNTQRRQRHLKRVDCACERAYYIYAPHWL